MADTYQYTMLMASLPHHGRLFTEKQTPISRLRLEQRLTMLTEEHARLLSEIEQLAQWDYLSHEHSDHDIVRFANEFIPTISDPTLQQLLGNRLELRTLIGALRLRHRGEPPPTHDRYWGYGRWLYTLTKNWSDPVFGLGAPFRWLKEANELMEQEDSFGLERLLLGLSWQDLNRNGAGHDFDFVAVAIYVLKWDIVARWVRYDGRIATKRFQTLIHEGLGGHARLFAG
jgi:hypothetical protein